MKKEVLLGIICLVFIIVNISISQSSNVGISISNLEALAGCESDVETQKGSISGIWCVNGDGSRYFIMCCNFDPGYPEYCNGRDCL